MTEEKWDEVYGVNVKGTFFCSRAAILRMRKSGCGQIVNVSSIAAETGKGSSIAYVTSKAAVSNMTKAMALAEAPAERVNAVAPGVVMTRWVNGGSSTPINILPTRVKPFGNSGRCRKAIYAIAINDFITGAILPIDGGRIINV